VEDEHLTRPVTSQEICIALQRTKASKAAEPDGTFPNMLKHLGKQAIAWIAQAFTNVKRREIPKNVEAGISHSNTKTWKTSKRKS